MGSGADKNIEVYDFMTLLGFLINQTYIDYMKKHDKIKSLKTKRGTLESHVNLRFLQNIEDSWLTCVKVLLKERITVLAKSIQE